MLDGSERELATVMYYDERGRMIQRRSQNNLGGINAEYISFNFTGQPTQILNEQTVILHRKEIKTTELYKYICLGNLSSIFS